MAPISERGKLLTKVVCIESQCDMLIPGSSFPMLTRYIICVAINVIAIIAVVVVVVTLIVTIISRFAQPRSFRGSLCFNAIFLLGSLLFKRLVALPFSFDLCFQTDVDAAKRT